MHEGKVLSCPCPARLNAALGLQRLELSNAEKTAIQALLKAVRELRSLNVIRSDRYLGDLGEFLAARQYDLKLAKSKRQKGHDTEGLEQRTQVKFHNSTTRTNIDLGQPAQYDRVVVVLGPDSKLHQKGKSEGKVVFYIFDSAHVEKEFKSKKSFCTGKKGLGEPHGSLEL